MALLGDKTLAEIQEQILGEHRKGLSEMRLTDQERQKATQVALHIPSRWMSHAGIPSKGLYELADSVSDRAKTLASDLEKAAKRMNQLVEVNRLLEGEEYEKAIEVLMGGEAGHADLVSKLDDMREMAGDLQGLLWKVMQEAGVRT